MKIVLVLLSLVAVAYAGVGVLTREVEAEALRLWAAHCDGASEGGTDGTTFIYCKKAKERVEENLTHELALNGAGAPQDQIVFVQPPSYHYKHDVIVSGGGGAAGKTVIYVKPAKNTHEVNVQDQTTAGEGPAKPTLYFLKGAHGADAGGLAAASEPVEATAAVERRRR